MQLVDGIPVDYSGLPERYRQTVRNHIEHGYYPGSGWELVLGNDLRAVVLVDDEMAKDLPQIYRWLVNYAPSRSWGSPEKTCSWSRARRAERTPNAHTTLRFEPGLHFEPMPTLVGR